MSKHSWKLGDPEDHLKLFQSAAKTEGWAMPTWCHMFNSTLTGNARVWFDKLPKESIDSYEDLRTAFRENYLQQTKHIKDPVEIHHIKQRDGESTEDFMERYKAEVLDVEGAPECMRISGFMHGITHPGLIKCLIGRIRDLWTRNVIDDSSTSQHNAIIEGPGLRKIRAIIHSTRHGMLNFPVEAATRFSHGQREAEEAFQANDKLIAELFKHDAPREREELIIYLAAAKEAISAVLITEREEISGRMLKWKFELEGYDIQYRPRTAIKGQILADFIVERPEEESPDELMTEPEALPEPWTLFTDGSSCVDGSGAGLILTNPEGAEFTYAMRFRFDATNNEAEYEALIAGLRIAEKMGIKNLQANVDSKLVANQVNGSYIAKESGMVQYLNKVKTLAKSFKEFSIKQIPRSENKKADALSKIASTSFAHLNKQVLVEELKEKSIDEKEILDIVEEEDNTWMTPICEYLTKEILPEDKKKARAVRRKAARFGLPGEIISDNGKQFRDNPFKDWCEKLCIRQCFASVKHPQANGLVERANRSLGEGIKARLDEKSKDWIEELPHVLWAHRTMIKSSNGETPFSLTYGTEAVIPAEIGMPTLRTAEMDQTKNNEALGINLDLIEEKREQAAIQEAKSKKKMEKYYNSRVRGTSFKPGEMVYRSNEASHAKDGGKLGPKWEGPYEVKESLGKGAYKLKDRKGNEIPRTWNICNLKKCYIHEL
ncbi:reverse transcriptase domain-containing protein [Tanacetum coccineum]